MMSDIFLDHSDADTIGWQKCANCPLKSKSHKGSYRCLLTRQRIHLQEKCRFEPEGGLTFRQASLVLHYHQKWRRTLNFPKGRMVSVNLLGEALDVAIHGLRRLSVNHHEIVEII